MEENDEPQFVVPVLQAADAVAQAANANNVVVFVPDPEYASSVQTTPRSRGTDAYPLYPQQTDYVPKHRRRIEDNLDDATN